MDMDSDKHNIMESSSSSRSDNTLPLVFSFIAGLLAVIAIVLGAVSLSQNGTNNFNIGTGLGTNSNDDKIWTFAIGPGEGSNFEYLDEVTGQIMGFNVDILNAVCKTANKNCKIVTDIYSRCWDSSIGETQRGGDGLFAGYYDGCASWWPTYVRRRTFKFTTSFTKTGSAKIGVKPGNPGQLNWRDLTGKKIGFIDGWANDEACLLRQADTITGADVPPANVVHYPGRDELIAGLKAGEVDAVFDGTGGYQGSDILDFISDPFTCVVAGGAVMVRKDGRLDDWFNPAIESLLATTEYRTICKDLTDRHGHIAGRGPEDMCIGM